MFEPEYDIYKVLGGTIEVTGDAVYIQRRRFFKRYERTIPLEDIVGVQFAPVTLHANGYIYFATRDNYMTIITNARQVAKDDYGAAFAMRTKPLMRLATQIVEYHNIAGIIKDRKLVRAEQRRRRAELQRKNAEIRQKAAAAWNEFRTPPPPPVMSVYDQHRLAKKGLCCPRCGSMEIEEEGRDFSYGNAILGGLLLGPGGEIFGVGTGKKADMLCQDCGKRWRIKAK